MVIAVDFDGTCVTHEFPEIGKEIGAVPVLRFLVNQGHQIVLNTMRSSRDGHRDVLKEAIGDDWDKISKFFDNIDKLVCIDNTDEVIADIMSTYIKNKIPYVDEQLEQCHIEIFLDTNVGTLLMLSAEDFELYVWQD